MKAPLHTPMPPIVHVLKPPLSSVLPPDDWALDGKFGHMAFEVGNTGRLVRLADVLRWLQASRALPRSEALKLLCDGMPGEVMGWLYRVELTNWAVSVPAADTFGFLTAAQITARKDKDAREHSQALFRRHQQNGRYSTPMTVNNGRISTGEYPAPTEPGLPALLKRLNAYWRLLEWNRNAGCDMLDEPRSILTTLAIPLDKAHEFWGYGTVVTAPLSAEKQPASKEWTGERLAAHRAVFEADGKAAPMKRLAAFTGLSDRKIRRLIEAVEAPKTDVKLNSVWSSLVNKKR